MAGGAISNAVRDKAILDIGSNIEVIIRFIFLTNVTQSLYIALNQLRRRSKY